MCLCASAIEEFMKAFSCGESLINEHQTSYYCCFFPVVIVVVLIITPPFTTHVSASVAVALFLLFLLLSH